MTLDDFRKLVKPFTNAVEELAKLDKQYADATAKRDMAEDAALKAIKNVVNGVRGDTAEGEEGELYKAIGYTPTSQRASGLVRPKKAEAMKETA